MWKPSDGLVLGWHGAGVCPWGRLNLSKCLMVVLFGVGSIGGMYVSCWAAHSKREVRHAL